MAFPPPSKSRCTLWISGPTPQSLPGWGGDFVLSANNSLQLAYDVPGNAQATLQRIVRLLNTTPRQYDPVTNKQTTIGDDPWHQDWGAGLPAQVDELTLPQLTAFIRTQILKGLTDDATIAPAPPPQVVVTVVNPATLSISITFRTVDGQSVVIPGYNLAIATRAGG